MLLQTSNFVPIHVFMSIQLDGTSTDADYIILRSDCPGAAGLSFSVLAFFIWIVWHTLF